jgi:hypothetical protein
MEQDHRVELIAELERAMLQIRLGRTMLAADMSARAQVHLEAAADKLNSAWEILENANHPS